MLKLAKAFIIIGMVLQFYLIYPIIVGALTLKKMKKVESVNELEVYGILNLFFVSIIAGILLLVAKEKDLAEFNGKANLSKNTNEINGNQNV